MDVGLEKRITKWGWLAQAVVKARETVTDDVSVYEDEVVAEVMHFYRPGKFHTHEKTEVVICVAGSGFFVIDRGYEENWRIPSYVGIVRIIPGEPHLMEPGPDGMTCVLWYE